MPPIVHRVDDHGEKGEELQEDGDGHPAAEERFGEDVVSVERHRPHDEGDGDDEDEEQPRDSIPSAQMAERLLVERVDEVI